MFQVSYYPKLKGRLCFLSPVDPGDYQQFVGWVNDLESSLGMIFLSSVIGEAKEREIMERIAQGVNFAIVDNATGKAIGSCGIPSIDERNRHCEVGIFIGESTLRGKGYGTDALGLLCEFAFSVLNMHSVALRVYSFNKPAIRCYEKVGFKLAGRLRHAKRIGGAWHDELLMDIIEDEYRFGQVRGAVEARQALDI